MVYFSDGEDATVKAVNSALKAIGHGIIPNNPRVIVTPGGKDFEAYIVNDASKDLLIAAIIEHETKSQQHGQSLKQEWAAKSKPDQLVAILDRLKANKTQYGSRIGKILPVPAALQELFKKIDTELAPPKPMAETA